MTEEEYKVVEAMETYGGSFVQALAQCFHRANHVNFIKLRMIFPEEWATYLKFANEK